MEIDSPSLERRNRHRVTVPSMNFTAILPLAFLALCGADHAASNIVCQPQVVIKGGALTITFRDVPHPAEIMINGPNVPKTSRPSSRFVSLTPIPGGADNGFSALVKAKTMDIQESAPLPKVGGVEADHGPYKGLSTFYAPGQYKIVVGKNLETDDRISQYGSCIVAYRP